MDEVSKELIEVKAKMEKLKADYHMKAELSESLQIAHNEQHVKIQEMKMEFEKQAEELNAKEEELSLAKQSCEDLKLNLHEKESIIKHLSSTNEQIRMSSSENLQKIDKETKKLVSALEEANAKVEDQDRRISAYINEIEGLKGLLSISQKKCFEAEEKAKALKEMRQRDDLLMKLEQESRNTEERLKWKNEQFEHLEEAHQKLQNQFQGSKKDWESEKSTLLNEICSLQTNLETQVRTSESLRSQLQMCNQALAHEESRRKLLELQLSESKANYKNVVEEFQAAQSMVESLTTRRDEEIASLRDLMATKETHFKEMEYQRVCLQQENEELHGSLKELQEAQIIQAAGGSSLMKLRQKLRSLEQVHKECSLILKAKEAEWSSLTEKMEKDLVQCQLELSLKERQMEELQTQLEGCHSSMMQLKSQNEEISKTLLVLKSEFSEAHSEIKNSKVEMDLYSEKVEERISLLMEQLEKKNSSLVKAQEEIEQERVIRASLIRRVESLDCIEQQYFLMQKEHERYNKLLQESSLCQEHLKEQASSKESALREDLRRVSKALDQAHSKLAEKTQEISEIEFEFQSWKSIVERMEETKQYTENQLESYREENQEVRREMEAAILAKMESEEAFKQERELLLRNGLEKDKIVDGLRKQIALIELESERKEREAASVLTEAEKAFMQAEESLLQSAEEKDMTIDILKQQLVFLEEEFTRREAEAAVHAKNEAQKILEKERESLFRIVEEKDIQHNELHQQIFYLKEESVRRETEAAISAMVDAEKAFNKEKKNFLLIAAEKDKLIDNQRQQILLLEQELVNMECTKQSEINEIYEAWKKLATDWIIAKLDIHDQNLYVSEQEEELNSLKQRLDSEEKSLSESRKRLEQLKAELETRQWERKKDLDLYEEVEAERKSLLNVNSKLLSDRDGLMHQMIEFYDRIGGFSKEDMELMKSLDRIVQKLETGEECQGDELFSSSKDEIVCPPLKKKAELDSENRSPLKVLNN